jgi:hypothetical protein
MKKHWPGLDKFPNNGNLITFQYNKYGLLLQKIDDTVEVPLELLETTQFVTKMIDDEKIFIRIPAAGDMFGVLIDKKYNTNYNCAVLEIVSPSYGVLYFMINIAHVNIVKKLA